MHAIALIFALTLGVLRPPLHIHRLDNGRTLDWKQLKGNVVVIDFWASWCGPCVSSIPKMNAIEAELAGERVKFVAVTYEPRAKAKAFLAGHPMKSTVAIDDDLATFSSFEAWGIPMIYIFDRDGRLASIVHPDNFTADVVRTVLVNAIPHVEQHPGWKDAAGAAKYFREQLELDRAKWGKK